MACRNARHAVGASTTIRGDKIMTQTFFATSSNPAQGFFRDGSSVSVGLDGTFTVDDKYASEIINAGYVRVMPRGSLASRPTVAPVGYRYYDTTLNMLMEWDGAAWQRATPLKNLPNAIGRR